MRSTNNSRQQPHENSPGKDPVSREDLLRSLLSMANAGRAHRERSRDLVLQHPQLFPDLMELVFATDHELQIRAAWVAELVCLERMDLLASQTKIFIENISRVTNESALRPVAKMAYLLSGSHFDKPDTVWLPTSGEVDLLVSSSFDWLIGEHKVATQVFAMKTLFLWSGQLPWIQQELRHILERNAVNSSMAYRAAARKILEKI